jgi:hypothetical protein
MSENSPDGVFKANNEYLKTATKILKAFIKDFKNETGYLESEGEILTKEETEDTIKTYLKDLDLEKMININFSNKLIAPTSISHDTKK